MPKLTFRHYRQNKCAINLFLQKRFSYSAWDSYRFYIQLVLKENFTC